MMTIYPCVHLSAEQSENFIQQLRGVVGTTEVLTKTHETQRYRQGYRYGIGDCLAVVRPGTLWELWQILALCCQQGVAIIMQAANTGLTGGSTPDGNDYDRDLILISTLRLQGIHLLNSAKQVICFPGTTLHQLEQTLKPLQREPHSLIGSSCVGASVLGGICNNSGGALVQRGPAYTELALYARIDKNNNLQLVNHLGIDLGKTPEEILTRLAQGNFKSEAIDHNVGLASDQGYSEHVRKIDEKTPARFNADPRRLYEASGSAGKIALFAARLDTFEAAQNPKLFYIGTNDTLSLAQLRRTLLAPENPLPIAAEYMHRECFDMSEKYGKDIFLLIRWFGTNRLAFFDRLKNRLDQLGKKIPFLPRYFSDYCAQKFSQLMPNHLPQRLKDYRESYAHHLMLKVDERQSAQTEQLLTEFFKHHEGAYFCCTTKEAEKAFLHRFVSAGALSRYYHLHPQTTAGMVSLDVALPRNTTDWFEQLPDELNEKLAVKMYYGHFLCHVMHQNYVVKQGVEPQVIEHELLKICDQRGAFYPAEHNVGHLYEASSVQKTFFRQLDPCNCFNPGIGQTSKYRDWQSAQLTEKIPEETSNL